MTTSRLHCALAAATMLVCSTAAPRAATAPIALHYDPALAADGFLSPLLTVAIGTQHAVFLIDTGASVHTVAKWFVEAAGLAVAPTASTVTGSTGSETRVEVVAELKATIAGSGRLLLVNAVVTPFPPSFETHRIAGLISPQLLAAADEDAILDLRRPRLTFRPTTSRAGRSTSEHGRACINSESFFRNRQYAVRVLIDGIDAQLLLDTGATGTTLDVGSAAARAFQSRAVAGGTNQGVGGATDRLLRVPNVRLSRGGASAVVDVHLGNVRNACAPTGLLGMDALQRCVMQLQPSGVLINCAAE